MPIHTSTAPTCIKTGTTWIPGCTTVPFGITTWHLETPSFSRAIEQLDGSLRSLEEASDVVLDGMKDITGGSTHFFDPKRASPVWAKRAVKSRQIGAHRYLRLSSGAALRTIPVRSIDTWI